MNTQNKKQNFTSASVASTEPFPREQTETLILILEHTKNPDIDDDRGGYWQEPVTPKRVTMEISNLRDAQSSFDSWRDANGLGAGNMTKRSGRVTRKNGQFVGRFSYNGRFWNAAGAEVVGKTAAARFKASLTLWPISGASQSTITHDSTTQEST